MLSYTGKGKTPSNDVWRTVGGFAVKYLDGKSLEKE